MYYRFFSFVIPAHNEEKIIKRTIRCLQTLEYPADRYEIIVVENGSTDETYGTAVPLESLNTRVYSSEKGVSRARNYGFGKTSPLMEWVIFMDCDVFIAPSFLSELNTYLAVHPRVGYGATTVNLDSTTLAARFWSWFNNLTYRLFKVLFTVHIIRRDIAEKISYDEELISGEDIQYGKDAARLTKYFFMPTKSVRSSPRRFEKKGYLWMFFSNLYHGATMFVLPKSMLKKMDWEVIR